jgi:hypothetical protein
VTPEHLFNGWLTVVAGLTGPRANAPQTVANDYLTTFPLQEAVAGGATESELMDFLVNAFRAYCKVAASVGIAGWFYAWFDEMSGTLRCSLAAVSESRDLPFSCRFEVSDNPRAVSRAALRSRYLEGIPADELEAVPWIEPDFSVKPFVLSIYARPIVRSC